MAYYLKVNNSSRETTQTINLTVGYDSAYVNICWLGVITDNSNCFGDDVQTYCQSVYIGINGCTARTISDTITWHDCVITYVITQEADPSCTSCDKVAPPCELIDAYVSPYYIPYKKASTSKIYYSYWEYSVNSDCEIVRTRKNKTASVSFSEAETDKKCDASSRIISKTKNLDCIGSKSFDFYVQMPDICCDTPSGICYEISDVYYVNSAGTLINDVSPSGETIYFYFDYKKIETDDKCNTKTSFGRFDGKAQNVPWVIDGCHDSECCRRSGATSTYTWTSHKSCESQEDIKVPLSIIRRKDINYSGDCSNVCDPDTGYCVDNQSIKTYYKDIYGNWIPWGQMGGCVITANPLTLDCNGNVQFGVSSEGSSWNWVDENYEIPYYGGSMKVTWEYSAITIYDDCTSGVTSGNEYEDIVDILPYDGDDCYDETKCYNVTLASQNGNKCDGGSATFSAAPNTSQKKYADKKLEYVFKKSPCEFDESAKSILPPSLVTCGEGQKKCNEFEVPYKQSKKPCSDNCGTCVRTSRYRLTETTASSFTDSYSGCEIKLIDNPYWITVNVGSGTISYSVEANTGSDREGGVTYQVNGMNCYDTVIIWQHGDDSDEDSHGEDPKVECNCSTATFEAYSSSMLPSTGGTHLVVGSYIYDDCVTHVDVEGGGGTSCSISSDKSSLNCSGNVQFSISQSSGSGGGAPSWLSNISCENGFIYADVTENTDSQNERVDNLVVTYSTEEGECGSSTIQVKQNKGGCNLTLISDGTEICWEDGGSVTFTPQYGI